MPPCAAFVGEPLQRREASSASVRSAGRRSPAARDLRSRSRNGVPSWASPRLRDAVRACAPAAADADTRRSPAQEQVVHHAEPGMRRKRNIRPLLARVGEHDQMTSEIAAVDRRDVCRRQRTQVPGSVPVEEMALEPRELSHRCEGRLHPSRRSRRCRPSRSRGRRQRRADRGRCWSAKSDARRPASVPPGNCPAAACRPPASRRSRRNARCAVRSGASRTHPVRNRELVARPSAIDWPTRQAPAPAATEQCERQDQRPR